MNDEIDINTTHLQSSCMVNETKEPELVLLGVGVHGPGLPIVLELDNEGERNGFKLFVAIFPFFQAVDLAPKLDRFEGSVKILRKATIKNGRGEKDNVGPPSDFDEGIAHHQ